MKSKYFHSMNKLYTSQEKTFYCITFYSFKLSPRSPKNMKNLALISMDVEYFHRLSAAFSSRNPFTI